MRINNFEVCIQPGNETADGYIEMFHNTQYTLHLSNQRRARCDAQVEIDGKHVGTWRIPAQRTIRLERPVHDTGHFTFYKMGTPEAAQAQLRENDKLGLVQVTFTPEKPQPVIAMKAEGFLGEKCCARSAGGTGLSGRSSQRFSDAEQIERDYAQQTLISLRLVCREASSEEIRPLTSAPYANSVPPPVTKMC